ncbi:MAG: ADP-glyceromanno-heptose 6-epimerase [Deltaproteobacteria bacterium]|jgi:ADP-L-glycero-D-manno-heptose 6-epimerase|nr:ADP-glyceromanno-heptose 6-epimerase [Deltaproteobacteria bacterium]
MYIITGAAGFIGSALLRALNKRGVTNILAVDNLGQSEKWRNLVKGDYLAYLRREDFIERIREDNLLDSLEPEFGPPGFPGGISRVRAIFHLGACSSTTERNADYLIQNNLTYSKILCDYALRRGIRYIQASSAATYGDGGQGFDDDAAKLSSLRPLNMYGYSKHLFDLWALRTHRLESIASVKFFNVYGPNEYHKGEMRSMAHKAFGQVRQQGKIRLFKSRRADYADGGQLRDFIYVKDCAEILLKLAEKPGANGIFNLGTGRARSWNDLAAAVFAAMEVRPDIEYIPMPEELQGKYQYFTQAGMKRLEEALEEPLAFHTLEAGVADYLRNYLLTEDAYL